MKKFVSALMMMFALAVGAAAQIPQSSHVVMVLEENNSYSKIIGSSYLPYLNSLAQKYGLAMNYYANTHPSIGNYLMLTTGQIITNSDGYTGTVSANNLVREALTAGVTWKSYAESLPSAGYTGGDKYPYVKHHNPFAYFTDVVNSSSEKYNLVPFSQFSKDLANNALPRFSFIVPNMHHNMHDCPDGLTTCSWSQKATAADNWLKTNIAPLLSNAQFQQNGLLIITWDEGNSTDTAHGGGHVATVVIGPKVKPAYKSTTFYQEQSLLRTVLATMGITSNLPGASASAPLMSDFFGSTTTTTTSTSSGCTLSTASPSVTICTPTNNATVTSPVHVVAGTTDKTSTVSVMQIWLDGVKVYQVYAAKLDTYVTMTSGTHRVTVQAKDAAGTTFKQTIYVTTK